MILTQEEILMLEGKDGPAVQKSLQILSALGKIYGAERMVPVTSVQVAGVSYDNLGEAGLEFLSSMADGGGRVRVLTTLNPAGMDVENWQAMGIPADFARSQERVIEAFARMGVLTTCTCTPYLSGNKPGVGEHIAWAESSAVCFANSILGARTNREGGPSALAAALTGRTPAYGLHLVENRVPGVTVEVRAKLEGTYSYGALGYVIGKWIEREENKSVPFITGLDDPGLENLKSLCASIATYGGAALFHIDGVTPEADQYSPPSEVWVAAQEDIDRAVEELSTPGPTDADFFSLGCPHLSIDEVARIAELIRNKKVKGTFWITTSRPVKSLADQLGYTQIIEAAGATFATDTCCVVAPIKGRFRCLVTDSAKACYYAASKNRFDTRFLPFDSVVLEAVK
ncbi:MAG: DUF521 domain-containing protein [Chloroflexi bacterium]|nr:MAG: DUF521 domain-containing protein [Chloroflexota bacterium]